MSLQRVKSQFVRLEGGKKLIGIGGLVLAVSALLPWYAELDTFSGFSVGDRFLGVTGPASLIGIFIVLFSGFSFYLFLSHLLGRKLPKLPVSETMYHLFVAVESLFLLIIVNSVFFHPKFGVNITLKESQFGMILAFAGAIALLAGAYLEYRRMRSENPSIGKIEPLVKLEPRKKPMPSVPTVARERAHGGMSADQPKIRPIPKHKPMTRTEELRQLPILGEMPAEMPAKTPVESAAEQRPLREPSDEESAGSYKIRTDL